MSHSRRKNVLNIIYDGEYNINYCIWLITKERSKQRVLAVPAARRHFSRKVTQRFRRKLPTIKSMSNQPALWTLGTLSPSRFTSPAETTSWCVPSAQINTRTKNRLSPLYKTYMQCSINKCYITTMIFITILTPNYTLIQTYWLYNSTYFIKNSGQMHCIIISTI
jgi:hypothetical protein